MATAVQQNFEGERMNDSATPPFALVFSAQTAEGPRQLTFATGHLVLAGWVGRDTEALEAHIRELEALGVARPATTPVFYRVSRSLVLQTDEVQVSGRDATGEAEHVEVEESACRRASSSAWAWLIALKCSYEVY